MHIKTKMAARQRLYMDPFNLNQWATKDEYKQQELHSLTNGLRRIVKAFEPKLLLSDQLVKIELPSHFLQQHFVQDEKRVIVVPCGV